VGNLLNYNGYTGNPLITLAVKDQNKTNNPIKEIKTERGDDLIITVWDDASNVGTILCNDFDPNANSGNGSCNDVPVPERRVRK